jgi:hypothetical protein
MLQMIQLGGGGIWPVITFSITALVAVVMHVVRPTKARRVLVRGAVTLTLASACLGCATGIRVQALTLRSVEELPALAVGVGEALSLVVLALIVTILVLLAATIGDYRLAERNEQAPPA